MNKLYIAYGSNLNMSQMALRCPTATVFGTGMLENWILTFRSMRGPAYATIKPCLGEQVPVVIWNIDRFSEISLDHYEGYPHFYKKENINVLMDTGDKLNAMAYIMNNHSISGIPSAGYVNTIAQGYIDNSLKLHYLGHFLKFR